MSKTIHGMSLDQKRRFLNNLKLRARLHQPGTAARVQAEIGQMLDSLKDGTPEEKADVEAARKAYSDMIIAAANGDQAVRAELAQLRIIRVNNFITARSNVMKFFETVELAANEIPYIDNTTRQEIQANFIGQDGGLRRTQPIKSQSQVQVDLHMIATQEYEYPLMDIYKGPVADDAKANVDITFDLDRQIELKIWPMLRKAVGPFVLTGPRALYTYVAQSAVNKKNLPTTNLLVPPGNTSRTLWRKECMDVVLQYIAAWGEALPGGEAMAPAVVYIPSSEVMGYLSQITMTSQPNSMVEQVIETGFVLDYGGRTWVFLADATLDPDQGLAYVQMNRPIGYFFTKPSMDQTFDDTSMANRKQNKGTLAMSKVIGAASLNNMAMNIAAVQYHDPR